MDIIVLVLIPIIFTTINAHIDTIHKYTEFSSEEEIEDDYFNNIENDNYEPEMSEQHLSNESFNEEPMIYIDLVTMLPMPPNRRQGRLERRQSVSNDKRFALFSIIGILGAIGAAFHIYKTAELQDNLSSLVSSTSDTSTSLSSICEKVKELTRVEPGDAMQLIKLVEVTEPTC